MKNYETYNWSIHIEEDELSINGLVNPMLIKTISQKCLMCKQNKGIHKIHAEGNHYNFEGYVCEKCLKELTHRLSNQLSISFKGI